MNRRQFALVALSCGMIALAFGTDVRSADKAAPNPTAETLQWISKMKVKPHDWPMWGGSPSRNNTPDGKNIATEWDTKTGKNIKWVAQLGSQTYGNPVVANGKVYVGTNNGAGYLKRYPAKLDLGCLVCFDEATGKFLWQHSSEKLPSGRVHDWPLQGICCAPLIDGDRLWYVTSRGEVVCLDTEGFHDKENDGPYLKEKDILKTKKEPFELVWEEEKEADVVWKLDMMKELGISQHNMCSCSVTIVGDKLFVNTSNGVDEAHITIPAPDAPTFLCLDKKTGKVLWSDNTPGRNVLHGQWSSPAWGKLGDVEQVLFGAGDGWLYSFASEGESGKAKMLWKFDCNPKTSKYELGGRATRNHLIGTPTIYDGLVYIAVGEDPEHGEGPGHMWCIDPTKRGDVSPTQVFNKQDPAKPIAHKRLQACDPEQGDFEKPNPNSAMVWHYEGNNPVRKGQKGGKFEETMHRTCGTVAIRNGLLVVPDFSGLVHCVDAKTGKGLWSHDMLAASWGSAMIVEDRIYVGDEDGDITIFKLSPEKEIVAEINMENSVYSTPVVANNVLFISNKDRLFAITPGAQSAPLKSKATDGGDGE